MPLLRLSRSLSPSQTICAFFALAIAIGAFLLWLPWSQVEWQPGHSSLVALFTATSAVCVTGLAVVDTGSYFTPFGQLIILILIQLGGLGYMAATSFLVLLVGRVSLRDRMTTQEAVGNTLGQGGVRRFALSIILMTVIFEGLGALGLALKLIPDLGWIEGLWSAVFHSVSAFNNAGFSLNADSLTRYQANWWVNSIIVGLIIAGGIGYNVILTSYQWLIGCLLNLGEVCLRILEQMSLRAAQPTMAPLLGWLNRRFSHWEEHYHAPRYSLSFKIAVQLSVLLVLGGTALIFITEVRNTATLAPLSPLTQLLGAFFQSVTTRTAGFNTIDIGALRPPTLLIFMVLMFIGASPGGTGGGIKTTTAAALISCTHAVLRGNHTFVLFGRSIAPNLIYKSLGILVGSILVITGGTTLILLIEGDRFGFDVLLFEVVSAYATVGLSAVGTSELNSLSQTVLIPVMYCGRVGLLLLISALSNKRSNQLLKYPEETVLIG